MKKILLDSCVWGLAKDELNKLGYSDNISFLQPQL